MPSDFGDESGEKLFDWMLRIGQDAGQQAMLDTADKLAAAFKNARKGLGQDASPGEEVNEWAKLNMKDFADLPEYDSRKELISSELDKQAVVHEFANEAGREFLVFKVKDVHEVDGVFKRLEEQTVQARDKAKDAELSHDRDSEPLEQRAAAAREASRALESVRGSDREIQVAQNIRK